MVFVQRGFRLCRVEVILYFCQETKVAKIYVKKSSAACEPRFLFTLCLRKLTKGALLFFFTFVPKQKYKKEYNTKSQQAKTY